MKKPTKEDILIWLLGSNLVMVTIFFIALGRKRMQAVQITNENVMQLIHSYQSRQEPMLYLIFLLIIFILWKWIMESQNKKPQGALR